MNAKRKKFCREYIKDLNGAAAAIRASYSKNGANKQGSYLLTLIDIQEKIREYLDKQEQLDEITTARLIKEMTVLGLSNMNDFAEWGEGGVTLIDSSKLTPEQTACVSEVYQTVTKDGGSIKFKLHDKKYALEMLGRYKSIFTDNVNLSGSIEVGWTDDE